MSWDFIDGKPLDLSTLTPQDVFNIVKKMPQEERDKILKDLSDETADAESKKKAIETAEKIGRFLLGHWNLFFY